MSRLAALSLAAAVVGTIALGCSGPSGSGSAPVVPDVPAPPGDAFAATVERVVDGDTFIARRGGQPQRVRLIGIDAPESVQPDAPVECFGPEAADSLEQMLAPGTRVDAAHQAGEPVDQFGRQLWDVWLDDGRFVQAELVRQGAVRARAYRPHTQHADLLDRLDDAARDAEVGLHRACS